MSILIKGMKMPKNCRECFACKAELSQEKKVIYVCCFAMTDCPLIPVPPHGDLIDRDALTISTAVPLDGKPYQYVHIDNIKDAPTIISTDESNMDSFIHIFEEDDEKDGMDSFIRILKD